MQRTKRRDRGQLCVFHFPKVYVFSEAFDLKPTRMAVPDTWRQPKAALSLRFAAALHTMGRLWTVVASAARQRFDVGVWGFREIIAYFSRLLLVRTVSEVFDLRP